MASSEVIGGLADDEVEQLDWSLAGYDKAGVPPPGKSKLLYSKGQAFNPKPATRDDINKYIDSRNKARPVHEQLPHI